MSQVNISLAGEDAQTLLDMLEATRNPTRAQKRLVERLSATLSQQLDELNRKNLIHSDAQSSARLIEQFRDQVLLMIPHLRVHGLSQQSVSYIHTVEEIYRQAKEAFQPLVQALPPDQFTDPGSAPTLPPHQVQELLEPFIRRIDLANKKLLAGPTTALAPDQSYPHPSRRACLAQRCFRSSLREASDAADWSAPDMIALCFSDMKSHVDMGLAILHGSPDKIRQAAMMDTACRDGLAKSVWDFVLDVLNGTAKGYARKSPSP